MAITAVRLTNVDLTTSTAGKWRASAEWYIDTDDGSTGSLTALTTAQATSAAVPDPIPLIGTSYALEGDSVVGLYLESLKIMRQTSPRKLKRFSVRGEYATPSGTGPPDVADPLLRPPAGWFEFGIETVEQTVGYVQVNLPFKGLEKDDFATIMNSAGGEFDTPLFEDIENVALVQQQNYENLDQIWALHRSYAGTVNSTDYYGFPKHFAKYGGIQTSQPLEASGTTYYSATLRVHLGRKPWYRLPVNRGYDAVNDAGDDTYQIRRPTDPEKPVTSLKVVTEPQLLDINGKEMAPNADGISIPWLTREPIDYGALVWIPYTPPPGT